MSGRLVFTHAYLYCFSLSLCCTLTGSARSTLFSMTSDDVPLSHVATSAITIACADATQQNKDGWIYYTHALSTFAPSTPGFKAQLTNLIQQTRPKTKVHDSRCKKVSKKRNYSVQWRRKEFEHEKHIIVMALKLQLVVLWALAQWSVGYSLVLFTVLIIMVPPCPAIWKSGEMARALRNSRWRSTWREMILSVTCKLKCRSATGSQSYTLCLQCRTEPLKLPETETKRQRQRLYVLCVSPASISRVRSVSRYAHFGLPFTDCQPNARWLSVALPLAACLLVFNVRAAHADDDVTRTSLTLNPFDVANQIANSIQIDPFLHINDARVSSWTRVQTCIELLIRELSFLKIIGISTSYSLFTSKS